MAIQLDQALLQYQTAVLQRDFEEANRLLPQIGERELEKLSLFLQGQGFLEEAIKVTKDTMRKLDLAISMKNPELAMALLEEKSGKGSKGGKGGKGDKEIGKYWSQVAEICLAKGDMTNALVIVRQEHDA